MQPFIPGGRKPLSTLRQMPFDSVLRFQELTPWAGRPEGPGPLGKS
jgi:hypothetical protein